MQRLITCTDKVPAFYRRRIVAAVALGAASVDIGGHRTQPMYSATFLRGFAHLDSPSPPNGPTKPANVAQVSPTIIIADSQHLDVRSAWLDRYPDALEMLFTDPITVESRTKAKVSNLVNTLPHLLGHSPRTESQLVAPQPTVENFVLFLSNYGAVLKSGLELIRNP